MDLSGGHRRNVSGEMRLHSGKAGFGFDALAVKFLAIDTRMP